MAKLKGNTLLVKENLNNSNHHVTAKNPLRDDAFDIDDNSKIKLIADKFKDIVEILGFDLTDDSIKDTPNRVAKMYVNEIFKGLNPTNKPKITLFKNEYEYYTPLVELNIPFTSFCEHHFVPIQGKANIVYIPKEYVIGLSKIHRLVNFYARRPQVQERLTKQIAQELSFTLKTNDVGVALKATHSCISCRGVEDLGSSTLTSTFLGQIKNDNNLVSVLLGSN
ncbi:MAG: GTP cyclohydrolase I FolE [Flavobacteriales bacterium]|jgi:GTP cyclohydrolase IA|nr:GTP cyclohydrolase I FolE [Flavobacteriales bacterium]MBQ20117.1 GTP cyclohydrolase I FolE [Flavobacteriales bacterium]|tara:strand:- start:170453 stop:171121 length:669 start_codon:yes stop_codon:yes gene_type:complete